MDLSIIIVSYNTKALLQQCLESLTHQRLPPSRRELIVVDNASTDGTVPYLRRHHAQATLIFNPINRGFAAANNQGLVSARGQYVLLLNSDTRLNDPDTLSHLISFLSQRPKAAIVTPRVELVTGELDLACHRGLPTPWNAFTYFSRLERCFPQSRLFSGYHQLYRDLDVPHIIDATAATAILVRRRAIDQVGFFDERFFLYGEDLDWCKRFTDAGWQIWYDPTVTVLHLKSASGKGHPDKNAKLEATNHFYQTMKQFYEKHYVDTYPRWLRQLVYWGIDVKQRIDR